MEGVTSLLPGWLIEWLQVYIAPFFEIQARVLVRALLHGATDAILFISLPLTLGIGSQAIWRSRYQLTSEQQQQIESWASVSKIIAYQEDIPPVVPLVLWYKENGLKSENPTNCEGIMGLHTAVSSGELPCFPAGPIGTWETAYQLLLGARTFKSYCPEVTYTTTNPNILKSCYLRYNAGPKTKQDPNKSAYVMNGYDEDHQNMILTDIHGRTYQLSALGAWPVHLSVQTQLAQRSTPMAPPILLAPMMLSQELLDQAWTRTADISVSGRAIAPGGQRMCRQPVVDDCLIAPHDDGDRTLRPSVSPLLVPPDHSGPLTCGLLPGVALTPPKASIVLAPMSGYLKRHTDEFGHLAIQIENEEWIVWITGLRSYTHAEGAVTSGTPIGAISGAGRHTADIHYAVYDKIEAGFVDPLSFIPMGMCPPSG